MATAAKQTTPTSKPADADLLDDKGAFSGSPPEDDDTPPSPKSKKDDAPPRVKVKIGDQELETDPGSAAAINSLMQMNAQMLAQIQAGYRAPSGSQPEKKADAYDYETGLFTEPAVALKRLREEIKTEIKNEMTGQYNAAESKKEFWNGFYTANPELKDNKLIVDAVVQRDWNKLSVMPVADADKAIATAAKKEIMRLSGGKSKSDEGEQNNLEGGSAKNPPSKSRNSEESAVTSLSDVIRNRQAARRKAQFTKE